MGTWSNCKNILCIRPDNMGDVIMSTPAFRALKQSFDCVLTLLTSAMGNLVSPYIPEINETIVFDLPWIKSDNVIAQDEWIPLIDKLRSLCFDAVVIFTVYSQNPLPTALLAYMANIPLRLAYCRENPYRLLTDWIPDKEPYSFIQHQVKRDLHLVEHIGAKISEEKLFVQFSRQAYHTAIQKLQDTGIDIDHEWLIMHPGVSETRRAYPVELWIEAAKLIYEHTGKQILLTGSANEKPLTDHIRQQAGEGIFSVAGLLSIEEFIAVIANSSLLISVNTASVHIAAATQTPVIVLYALTNPQHTPWKTPSVVLPFSVPPGMQSKNEVIRYVNENYFNEHVPYPGPAQILQNALVLMSNKNPAQLFV